MPCPPARRQGLQAGWGPGGAVQGSSCKNSPSLLPSPDPWLLQAGGPRQRCSSEAHLLGSKQELSRGLARRQQIPSHTSLQFHRLVSRTPDSAETNQLKAALNLACSYKDRHLELTFHVPINVGLPTPPETSKNSGFPWPIPDLPVQDFLGNPLFLTDFFVIGKIPLWSRDLASLRTEGIAGGPWRQKSWQYVLTDILCDPGKVAEPL